MFFKLTENNDWEGEKWRVHFEVNEQDKIDAILKIADTLSKDEDTMITIEEIKKMPKDFECAEDENLDEEDWDWLHDEDSESTYYPLFQNNDNINWDLIFEIKDSNSVILNNDLYKLRMFQ